jgi:hypothetical protein
VLTVSDGGFVNVLGVAFPVEQIREAMLETGGVVVAQAELVAELEKIRRGSEAQTGKPCTSIAIEAIPGTVFYPKHFKVHAGIPGTPTFDTGGRESRTCLYFAARKLYSGAGSLSRPNN